MEDVLELYSEEYDQQRPVVCFDETSKQLIKETRQPLSARAGAVARFDYDYERKGVRNLFIFCEPQRGWRHVAVTEQRRMLNFAEQMKWLVDVGFPEAERVRYVCRKASAGGQMTGDGNVYDTGGWNHER